MYNQYQKATQNQKANKAARNPADTLYEGINFAELQKLFQDNFAEFGTSRDKEIYLFFGATRAGKSTLINKMLDHTFEEYLPEDELYPLYKVKSIPNNQRPFAEVGTNSSTSCTTLAKVFSADGKNYCDCPGILEARTNETAILTSLSTEYAVRIAKSILGMILVVDIPSLDAGTSEGFKELAKTLGSVIKDPDSVKDSIIVVFTKLHGARVTNDTMRGKLNRLIESSIINAGDDPSRQYEAELAKRTCRIIAHALEKGRWMAADNFVDGTDKNNLLAKINGSNLKSIAKEQFDFNSSHEKRAQFNIYVQNIFDTAGEWKANYQISLRNLKTDEDKLITEKEQLKEHSTKKEKIDKSIKNLEAGKEDPEDAKYSQANQIEANNLEKTRKQESIRQNSNIIDDANREKEAAEKELNKLNVDTSVEHSERIEERDTRTILKIFGYMAISLSKHLGMPIKEVYESCEINGTNVPNSIFERDKLCDLEHGYYKATYKSEYMFRVDRTYWAANFVVKVTFMVASKNFHAQRIRELEKKISNLDAKISALAQENKITEDSINSLMTQNTTLNNLTEAQKKNKRDMLELSKGMTEQLVRIHTESVRVRENMITTTKSEIDTLRKEVDGFSGLLNSIILLSEAGVSFPQNVKNKFQNFSEDVKYLRTHLLNNANDNNNDNSTSSSSSYKPKK